MGHTLRIAVVGAGISGLSAAWLLSAKHKVTLVESEVRLGGHANTVEVDAPEGRCAVDTGFIVYNTASYPNLIAMFEHLGVPTAPSDMSFAVSLDGGGYEYSGGGLGSLIGHASNLARPAHWRLMREIFRFFREASAIDARETDPAITLGDWLAARGYSQAFIHAHIVPMGSAIWSTPADEMLAFPFAAFARFFANHGLLQTFDRPPWRTVKGGSREYVQRLVHEFSGTIASGDPVVDVRGRENGATVTTRSGGAQDFDAVIIACHADETLAMSPGLDAQSKDVLSAFRYASNTAVLHTDATQMPHRRRLWSSWNYMGDARERAGGGSQRVSVTYWMNRLQPLATETDYFVTLNPTRDIAVHHVLETKIYDHPMFDCRALSAQAKLASLQGLNSIWFAGSYFGFGFHEDGVQSGLAAAEDLSARLGGEAGRVVRPWAWDKRQSRVAFEASTRAAEPRAREPAEACT